ncbi:hypothetical protein AMECASPLE_002791, partial [Ameca splendens]
GIRGGAWSGQTVTRPKRTFLTLPSPQQQHDPVRSDGHASLFTEHCSSRRIAWAPESANLKHKK